ncbi:MAG: hypothetical protein ACJAS9_000945 [Polaribacter sp.]|jgi:hypothetical protein
MRRNSPNRLTNQSFYKRSYSVACKFILAIIVCLFVASCGNKSVLFLDKAVKDVLQKEDSETTLDPVEAKKEESKGEIDQ